MGKYSKALSKTSRYGFVRFEDEYDSRAKFEKKFDTNKRAGSFSSKLCFYKVRNAAKDVKWRKEQIEAGVDDLEYFNQKFKDNDEWVTYLKRIRAERRKLLEAQEDGYRRVA